MVFMNHQQYYFVLDVVGYYTMIRLRYKADAIESCLYLLPGAVFLLQKKV